MSSSNHMLNELNLDQVFRRNKINLNCERHFKVFNSFNTIPEFCFGCYKIQISPKNIIELIKLYIIFDQFEFGKDIFRKTLIEVRPKVSGTYKGLIYCSSKEESEEILNKIIPILKINLGNDVVFEVKEDVQNLQFLILVLKSWIVILNLIRNGKKMKKLLTTRKIKKTKCY